MQTRKDSGSFMITSCGGRGLSNFFLENDCQEDLTKHSRLVRDMWSLIRRRRKDYEPGRSSELKTISFGKVES
jgi:hypothetical protein